MIIYTSQGGRTFTSDFNVTYIVQDVLTTTIAALHVLDAGSYTAIVFATCDCIATANLQDPSLTI